INKGSTFAESGLTPLPNHDHLPTPRRSTPNLTGLNNQVLDSDQYMGRADHRFGDNDRIFAHSIIVTSTFIDDPVTRVALTNTDYPSIRTPHSRSPDSGQARMAEKKNS